MQKNFNIWKLDQHWHFKIGARRFKKKGKVFTLTLWYSKVMCVINQLLVKYWSLVGSKYAVQSLLKLSSRNKFFKCICAILDNFLLFMKWWISLSEDVLLHHYKKKILKLVTLQQLLGNFETSLRQLWDKFDKTWDKFRTTLR